MAKKVLKKAIDKVVSKVTKKKVIKDVVKSKEVKAPAPKTQKVNDPKLEVKKPKVLEELGSLNGQKIIKNEDKVVNGKLYSKITILNGSTYLLTDSDVQKQVEI